MPRGGGYIKTEVVYDPIQNVDICFLYSKKDSMFPCLELISIPKNTNKNCPIQNILKNENVKMYHICYSVENIDVAILDLKRKSFMQISNISKAVALENKRICFLFNKNVGLIELVEE